MTASSPHHRRLLRMLSLPTDPRCVASRQKSEIFVSAAQPVAMCEPTRRTASRKRTTCEKSLQPRPKGDNQSEKYSKQKTMYFDNYQCRKYAETCNMTARPANCFQTGKLCCQTSKLRTDRQTCCQTGKLAARPANASQTGKLRGT